MFFRICWCTSLKPDLMMLFAEVINSDKPEVDSADMKLTELFSVCWTCFNL